MSDFQLEASIRSILLAHPDLPEDIAQQIRPDGIAPTDQPPLIVIEVFEETFENDLDDDDDATSLVAAEVSVFAVTTTKKRTRQLANWIRDALHHFSGQAGDIEIQACEVARRRHKFVPKANVEDTDWYETETDLHIMYEE